MGTSYIDEKGFKLTESRNEYISSKAPDLQEAVIEVTGWFSRLTLGIIGVAGFGYYFGALDHSANNLVSLFNVLLSPLIRMPTAQTDIVHQTLKLLIEKIPFMEYIPHPRIKIVRVALKTLEIESDKIVKEKRAELLDALRNDDVIGKDLITLLCEFTHLNTVCV